MDVKSSYIVFVCKHGAAKSIIAAAYFNKIAAEMNLPHTGIARGTNPDQRLSPETVSGLQEDGLDPTESFPKQLFPADMKSADRIVSFCQLPGGLQQTIIVELWNDIPPVSENYQNARDAILEHLYQMVNTL